MNANLTGRLLIASPHLSDGNFLRSVVFIIRHDVEGAFGLTINRVTHRRFRDLIDCPPSEGTPRDDDFIFRGGPVEGPLLALHDLAGVGEPCNTIDVIDQALSPSGMKVTVDNHPADPWGSMSIELGNPPAWITGDDDHLRILLRRPDANVRYVAHYSGWGPGQLDHEIDAGGWLCCDADSEILFSDPEDCWTLAVQKCGKAILSDIAPGIDLDPLTGGDPGFN
jgi:putative transcriptional regulator